jgi:hypothetical protein
MFRQELPLQPQLAKEYRKTQRRATVRYRGAPASLSQVLLPNSYQALAAWVLDLGLHGTGLQIDRVLEPGTLVLIEMKGPTRDLDLELKARVIHATRQRDGTCVVGCAFARPLSPDELDALL